MSKSEEAAPSPGMGKKVRNIVLSDKKINPLGNARFRWRKALATAVCLTLAGASFSLAASPFVRAGATEKANEILNKVHVIIHTEELTGGAISMMAEKIFQGGPAENSQEIISNNRAKADGIIGGNFYSAAQAEEKAGFKIKTPSYLPSGFNVPDEVFVAAYNKKDQDGKGVNTGKHAVSLRFDDGCQNDIFLGLHLHISEIGMEHKPEFRHEVIKVGDKDVRWFKSELVVQDQGKEQRKKVMEQALSWKADGMTYLLLDYSGLSKAELLKIMASIK